jgi:hypothetical protein
MDTGVFSKQKGDWGVKFTTHHSPLATRHSPLIIHHSPLTTM